MVKTLTAIAQRRFEIGMATNNGEVRGGFYELLEIEEDYAKLIRKVLGNHLLNESKVLFS